MYAAGDITSLDTKMTPGGDILVELRTADQCPMPGIDHDGLDVIIYFALVTSPPTPIGGIRVKACTESSPTAQWENSATQESCPLPAPTEPPVISVTATSTCVGTPATPCLWATAITQLTSRSDRG